MTVFGLKKSHSKIILLVSAIVSLIATIFLQTIGIIIAALVTSFVAQLIVKIKGYKINYEIAFGVGFLTMIAILLISIPLRVLINNEVEFWDAYASLFLILVIVGFFQQLITSTAFIVFGNK
jgi:hypothetical protein